MHALRSSLCNACFPQPLALFSGAGSQVKGWCCRPRPKAPPACKETDRHMHIVLGHLQTFPQTDRPSRLTFSFHSSIFPELRGKDGGQRPVPGAPPRRPTIETCRGKGKASERVFLRALALSSRPRSRDGWEPRPGGEPAGAWGKASKQATLPACLGSQ